MPTARAMAVAMLTTVRGSVARALMVGLLGSQVQRAGCAIPWWAAMPEPGARTRKVGWHHPTATRIAGTFRARVGPTMLVLVVKNFTSAQVRR